MSWRRRGLWYLCSALLWSLLPALLPVRAALGDVASVRIASGLSRPVFATAPAGDERRLFVIEQHSGRVRILELPAGPLRDGDFLTIGGLADGAEQGLLGLAFHPDYAANGFFFVNVTIADGSTEIRRYRSSADADVADAASAQLVLRYAQPQTNHNGGWIGFGPDGFLYIASGDGGGANDSATGHTEVVGNAQDTTDNLLGKILRIDVDGDDFPADPARNYAIPASNPFVDAVGDDEIWSYGLRNPWRASFDRQTGDLYIGDVGQGAREEIDVQPGAAAGGRNYGWSAREGTIATPIGGGARPPGAVDPVYDYSHGDGPFQGNSVIGGYVYRGPIEEIYGHYFFADYVSERIWSLVYDGAVVSSLTDRSDELAPEAGTSIDEISSFAEDATGNLYVLDLGGEIFAVVAAQTTTSTTTSSTTSTTTGATSTTMPSGTGVCGDVLESGTRAGTRPASVTASDALFVLRVSVGVGTCALCVCDTDDSGAVTASDALRVLQAAVGDPVALSCPPC